LARIGLTKERMFSLLVDQNGLKDTNILIPEKSPASNIECISIFCKSKLWLGDDKHP